ncbi:oxysterol-binding protein [Aphelenchoides avenae]|nr:oxysterol-binding protein [Aphelenchus avenae]
MWSSSRHRDRAVAGKDKDANYVRFEAAPQDKTFDEPPPKVARMIVLKQKKRRLVSVRGQGKRMSAKLTRGILKIHEADETNANKKEMANHKDVDLGHDDVRYDDAKKEFQVLYQRVEYRIKLCENSDEEYRHFRDAMREHVWFRQQLIDVGIESVSEYRPPVKKSDGDKPTASPDNTKPEASEDAAKRKRKSDELKEVVTKAVNDTIKAVTDDLKNSILKEINAVKTDQKALIEEVSSLRNSINQAREGRDKQKRAVKAKVESKADSDGPDITSSGRSTSDEEDSDEEASTKDEPHPATTAKTPVHTAKESKKPPPQIGPKKKDQPIEVVNTAAAARSSATLVTPRPTQSAVTHTAASATPIAATRATSSPELTVPRRRDHLPREEVPSKPISMLQFKNLPLHAFQPISVLQMVCEELRYAKLLLDKAAQQKDPLERMCTVTAFAFSAFPDISMRKRKPFNPLLGETFDFVSPDGWRYHSEQVSHHPEVSACHAVGNGWEWWQDLRLKRDINIFKASVSLSSDKGIVRLRLNGKEEYSWNKVSSTIYSADAEAEKRQLTVWGVMTIRSSTGFEAKLTFEENKNVSGKLLNPAKQEVVTLAGRWDRGLNRVVPGQNQEPLFMPVLDQHARCYGFSRFTMALNDITPEERPFLPRTDSRFRPDQRCLENGDTENGAKAKHALEEVVAQRKRQSIPHRQMWFQVQPDAFTRQEAWTTNGRYWKSRAAKFSDPHSQAMLKLFETK